MQKSKWPDGTPISRGNAFDWRGRPSVFTEIGQRQTLAYVVSTALRENLDSSTGTHGRSRKRGSHAKAKT